MWLCSAHLVELIIFGVLWEIIYLKEVNIRLITTIALILSKVWWFYKSNLAPIRINLHFIEQAPYLNYLLIKVFKQQLFLSNMQNKYTWNIKKRKVLKNVSLNKSCISPFLFYRWVLAQFLHTCTHFFLSLAITKVSR